METERRPEKVIEVVEQLSAELNPHHKPMVNSATHLEWDLGLGSIERHELLLRLERGLGEKLSSRAVFEAATVADLIGLMPGQFDQSWKDQIVDTKATGQVAAHPSHASTLIEALLYQVQRQPDREVLFFLEEGEESVRWTYPDLLRAAQKVAGGLGSLGVRAGERVGVMLPSGPDYLAAFYGMLWVGAVPVPLYPPFRLDQLEEYVKRQSIILKAAGVKHLISFDKAKPIMPLLKLHNPFLEKIVGVPELDGEAGPPRESRQALIQFTSGSTGAPKGVVLSHANLLHNIRGYGYGMDLTPNDVTVSWLPLYHDMGLIGTMLGSVYHGQPLALMGPQDFLARPSRWLWALHRYRGTVSPAPNFAYEICARKIPDDELEGLDLAHWRIALNGAEAVRPETLQRFSERFAPYGFDPGAHFPAYGLAEASLAVTFPPPGRGPLLETISREALESRGVVAACGAEDTPLTLVACGRPLPDMEVRVVDERRQVLPDRRRGLVEFRGPSSLEGYFEDQAATERVKDSEGWVATGDLGYLSEGELYLTGRLKDVIIKAGRNIQAEDVEDMVAEVEGVRRGCVAAFGQEHEMDGTEQLVILAESRTRVPEEQLELVKRIERHVATALGLPPDRVELLAPGTILKTPSGKIRRAECKKQWNEGTLGASGGTVAQLRKLILGGVGEYGRRLADKPREWLRRGWCLGWLSTLLLTPQLMALADRRLARRSLGALARLYLRLVGVPLQVRGESSYPRPCILVCNHCSTLDALVLSAAWRGPLTFLVAPWVAERPGLKGLIHGLGHIPVHRGDADVAEAQGKELEERLRRGETLAIFPEGGVEVTPGLRPFALGAFQLAARTGVPVIPVALQGTRKAQPYPEVVPRRVQLQATFGDPMTPASAQWDSVVELCQQARSWIANHCGDPLSHRRLRRND